MNLGTLKVGLAAVMLMGTVIVPTHAEEGKLTKNLYRARVLDVCIYGQYRLAEDDTKVLKACKCAAKNYVNGLEKDELDAALKKGTMSRSQKKVMLQAFAKCSK